jgi:glycosyltransferase involved in cell wall biosynthesis
VHCQLEKKIVHFLPWYSIKNKGGTEIFILDLAKRQKQQGQNVCVLSPGKFESEFYFEGIQIIETNLINTEGDFYQRNGFRRQNNHDNLLRLIKAMNTKIIYFHCFWFYQFQYLKSILEETSIQVIIIPHLSNFLCQKGNLRYKNKVDCDGKATIEKCFKCNNTNFAFSHFYHFLPNKAIDSSLLNSLILNKLNSRAQIEFYVKNFKIFESNRIKISVLSEWYLEILKKNIPNANTELFYNSDNQLISTVNGKHTPRVIKNNIKLLYVGRQTEAKGLLLLINAFKLLNSNKFSLTIIGPFDSGLSLESRDYLNFNITNLGPMRHEEIRTVFETHDCLIVPSIDIEMRPLIIIEGIQSGITIIGSNKGGISDLLKSYKKGVLFEAGNFVELKNTILKEFK